MTNYLTKKELLKQIGIDTFDNLSDEELLKLLALIKKIKGEDLISILKGLDMKAHSLEIIKRLNILCDNGGLGNKTLEVIRGYKKTLDALDYMVREGSASFEDLEFCKTEATAVARALKIEDYQGLTDELIEAVGAPHALIILIGAVLESK